jgi:cytochrome c biogenesis protein
MKFAIWIAVALAVASVAGILIQEFFPVRSEADAEQLARRLPSIATKAFFALHLHDPFRAGWFRALLGLLSLSLLLCSTKRFRSALRQAFRLHPLGEPRALLLMRNSATVRHVSPAVFDATVARLSRRFYSGCIERRADQYTAALHQGGAARTGPVLLHLGILALAVAGLVTSLLGKRIYVEAGAGQTVAIENSPFALRVEDFQIDTNERGEVKQYRSRLVFLEDGRPVAAREINVNNPMRHGGYSVYQASYATDPTRAASLALAVRTPAGEPGPASIARVALADLDALHPVPGFPGWEFRVARFFGHLKIGAGGPVNAARDFANPAAEIWIFHDGQPAGSQWAFLRFPAHARGDLPFVIELRDAQPALVTGLEIRTSPGTWLVWLGFLLATLGLVLAFLVRHRCVFLLARPAERGWTLWIAGRTNREAIAFAHDFERLLDGVRADARADARRRRDAVAARHDPATTPEDLESPSGAALVTPTA